MIDFFFSFFQTLPNSNFRSGDMYQSTYSFNHRSFNREEQMASSYWTRERRTRPWLQEPVTAAQNAAKMGAAFNLKCREPVAAAEGKIWPTEAQVSYLDLIRILLTQKSRRK